MLSLRHSVAVFRLSQALESHKYSSLEQKKIRKNLKKKIKNTIFCIGSILRVGVEIFVKCNGSDFLYSLQLLVSGQVVVLWSVLVVLVAACLVRGFLTIGLT